MNYEVYDQQGNLLKEYDLNLGRLESSTRIEHHPAVEGVEEVWHWETIQEYPNGGKDVKKVVDVPRVAAEEAYDEIVTYYIYHKYTEEELAELNKDNSAPSLEERIITLENLLSQYEIAYSEGVNAD